MPYLSVNLYYDQPTASFDPNAIVEQISSTLPEFHCDPDDKLQTRLTAARNRFTNNTDAERQVLERMEQDAAEQGPARSFSFDLAGQKIRGVIKGQYFQLLFDRPLPEEAIAYLRTLTRSLHSLGDAMAIEIVNEEPRSA